MTIDKCNNLREYIENFKTEDLLKKQIIQNEQKHLSKEYRTDYAKMDSLLHTDFVEYGKSGTIYNKDDILNSIPLECWSYKIESVQYCVKIDNLVVEYTLIRNSNIKMACKSKWNVEKGSLRLSYFTSVIII
jgi:hypothetical protein